MEECARVHQGFRTEKLPQIMEGMLAEEAAKRKHIGRGGRWYTISAPGDPDLESLPRIARIELSHEVTRHDEKSSEGTANLTVGRSNSLSAGPITRRQTLQLRIMKDSHTRGT